jgi:hypothetical protein
MVILKGFFKGFPPTYLNRMGLGGFDDEELVGSIP